jgi:ESCRT-II complex subunit VPS36
MYYPPRQDNNSTQPQPAIQKRVGITSIERNIEQRLNNQDKSINESFHDLSNLMNKAKEMVQLSVTITDKLKSNQKQSQDDQDDAELNTFKSCLLNMGIINNPVTKDSSGSKYHKHLAKEIYEALEPKIRKLGGIMLLSDAYCLLNRARGMAGLISPEDLLNACKELNRMDLKIKYLVYTQSNLHILQITEIIENPEQINKICNFIQEHKCLTAEKLSKILSLNSLVVKQQLLYAENIGKLCRDDTAYGLNFYINLFH